MSIQNDFYYKQNVGELLKSKANETTIFYKSIEMGNKAI